MIVFLSSLRVLIAVIALIFGATALRAHEFWVQPSTFRPTPGIPVGIDLRVGDDLEGVSVARRADHTVRFEVAGADLRPIAGREGDTPAGFTRHDRPGLHVVAYESRHSQIEIDGDRFSDYLADKGLRTVIAARATAGESELPGRERYARCAKALLAVGNAEGSDRRVGLTLELVAEDNPYLITSGQPLPLRLIYRGAPLSGALVKAWRQGEPQPVRARTDADGRVSMRLDGFGMWLVSSVHMVRGTRWQDAEWESYWSSLTFERRGSEE